MVADITCRGTPVSDRDNQSATVLDLNLPHLPISYIYLVQLRLSPFFTPGSPCDLTARTQQAIGASAAIQSPDDY